MELLLNCYACQGTGGLYDHGLGIDDECGECGGSGCLEFKDDAIPKKLRQDVNTLDLHLRKIGVANFIVGWEEASCPCCGMRLDIETSDDGRSVDIRCSEAGVCNFEIITW